jgi:transposase
VVAAPRFFFGVFRFSVNGYVRREEVRRLQEGGYEAVLTKSRFIFLKNPVNLTKRQALKLKDLVNLNLRTIRAWLLKEEFERFWSY